MQMSCQSFRHTDCICKFNANPKSGMQESCQLNSYANSMPTNTVLFIICKLHAKKKLLRNVQGRANFLAGGHMQKTCQIDLVCQQCHHRFGILIAYANSMPTRLGTRVAYAGSMPTNSARNLHIQDLCQTRLARNLHENQVARNLHIQDPCQIINLRSAKESDRRFENQRATGSSTGFSNQNVENQRATGSSTRR